MIMDAGSLQLVLDLLVGTFNEMSLRDMKSTVQGPFDDLLWA